MELIAQQLRRYMPDLRRKYGVRRLGLFNCYLAHHHSGVCELNVLVELEQPLGWAFFDLKTYLERKLQMRIDVFTEASLKPALRDEILQDLVEV